MRKIEMLEPQPTEQAPVTVENYPYGFRRRTQAQYWIETVEKRGQRVVFRTLNPNTQHWNKPKKSTYSDILVLYRNLENDHIESTGLSFAYTREKDLEAFLQNFPETSLSSYQKEQLILLRAIFKTREHLKVTIVRNPTPERSAEIEKNNEKTNLSLLKTLAYYHEKEKEKAKE